MQSERMTAMHVWRPSANEI